MLSCFHLKAVAVLFSERGDVCFAEKEGKSVFLCLRAAKFRVAFGILTANLMVEMRNVEGVAPLFRVLAHYVEQSYGIRTAGKSDKGAFITVEACKSVGGDV